MAGDGIAAQAALVVARRSCHLYRVDRDRLGMMRRRLRGTLLVAGSSAAAFDVAHAQTTTSAAEGLLVMGVFFVMIIGAIAILVAPIVIAFYRHHPNRWPIFGVRYSWAALV